MGMLRWREEIGFGSGDGEELVCIMTAPRVSNQDWVPSYAMHCENIAKHSACASYNGQIWGLLYMTKLRNFSCRIFQSCCRSAWSMPQYLLYSVQHQ